MNEDSRTQMGIIGAGPAGLVLAQLLHLESIKSVVLERHTRDCIEGRVREGVLEQGTVDMLTDMGVGERLHREGLIHKGVHFRWGEREHRVDFEDLCGKTIRVAAQGQIVFEATDVSVQDVAGDRPRIWYQNDGEEHELQCDFIAGCGFHGIYRPAIADLGFVLLSVRSPEVSRLYVQIASSEEIPNWPDAGIWEQGNLRMGSRMNEGPLFQKYIAGVGAVGKCNISPGG
ncbi:MAG: FAD-dependent monooxygenase [Acidobacteriota bacterium]